jgi:hypothetical protein
MSGLLLLVVVHGRGYGSCHLAVLVVIITAGRAADGSGAMDGGAIATHQPFAKN